MRTREELIAETKEQGIVGNRHLFEVLLDIRDLLTKDN